MTYVGIDNGISGAIAHVDRNGRLVFWKPMPTQKTRKGNELNIRELYLILWRLSAAQEEATVIIEEPTGSQNAKAASSMAGSFHSIRATVEILKMRYHRITPQSWQKQILKCKSGDTKPAALSLARSLWPKANWLENDRCRKAHDGAIDAALIAEYGRRNSL